MKFAFLLMTLMSLQAHSKLLDKIVGVLDEKIFTHAEIQRIQSNAHSRKMIAPLIYSKTKYSNKEILEILFQTHIIRGKLAELGIIISDSMVNSRIKDIEKSQGISKTFLINFLKSKNLNYNEYFSLIKQMIEISYFNSRIIAPLVSISDEEVSDHKVSLQSGIKKEMIYKVINYAFNPAVMKKYSDSEIINFLTAYKNKSQELPVEMADLSLNELDLESGSLSKNIYNVLRKTKSKRFSKPKIINGACMVFYMKSKRVKKTRGSIVSNDNAKQALLVKKSSKAIKKWIESEKQSHYIKQFI